MALRSRRFCDRLGYVRGKHGSIAVARPQFWPLILSCVCLLCRFPRPFTSLLPRGAMQMPSPSLHTMSRQDRVRLIRGTHLHHRFFDRSIQYPPPLPPKTNTHTCTHLTSLVPGCAASSAAEIYQSIGTIARTAGTSLAGESAAQQVGACAPRRGTSRQLLSPRPLQLSKQRGALVRYPRPSDGCSCCPHPGVR